MQVFFYLVVASVGLSIGSFLTAYTFRKQKGLSVLSGRSFCPHCKAKIAWFDNIPLLSFLFLRGKCRACGEKISLRYPLIEFLTAATFLTYFHYFQGCGGSSIGALCFLKGLNPLFALLTIGVIVSILISIIVIDLETKIIPDELTFLGILILMSFYLVFGHSALFPTLFAAFSASTFFLLIHLLTRGRGMGLGDVKFVILGGLLLGWPETLIWLFSAFLTGAVFGIILILFKRAKFGREIAFGPYLAGTLLFVLFFGDKVLNSWLFFLI